MVDKPQDAEIADEQNAQDDDFRWSIVVPAYNEEKRLGPTLRRIHEYMTRRETEYELIVVDDGSTDGTIELIEKDFPDVQLLKNPTNVGKGYSVRSGLYASTKDFVLFTDSDLSTPIEEIEKFEWEFNQGADMVIASRALPQSQLDQRQAWWREMSGRIFNAMVRLISGLPYLDTQCGFKAYRLPVAHKIARYQQIDGWAFDVEQLYVARQIGFHIREVPVRWINSADTRVNFLRASTQMLIEIIRIRMRHYDID
ncbi:MAG: dolichyl-phosphate beta-glucosyltransferase [Candidatus Sumerlaeia bacterium]